MIHSLSGSVSSFENYWWGGGGAGGGTSVYNVEHPSQT